MDIRNLIDPAHVKVWHSGAQFRCHSINPGFVGLDVVDPKSDVSVHLDSRRTYLLLNRCRNELVPFRFAPVFLYVDSLFSKVWLPL